ncbi:uncharacterized protein [Pocillopora verrucosa]|uniref:uncharacterized protein isoform X3 n=1 Tax=Pocillopora verrucosa TaxID=203993 RepID=UPI003342CF2B
MSFCEVEVYPKIPHSLGNEGLLFYKQTSRWQDSEWVAVENFRLYMYMEVTLTSSTVLETFDQPRDIYPNYPVRVGALQINDTVLAPFSSNYSLGKVTAVEDWLTGRYEIQPDSGGAARNFSHADLRHQDACKLQIVCPPNSECTREYMNDKFPTFYYICKCRKGFLSSRGTFMAVLNNDILDVCKGGINLSEGKPTNQSSTSGDAVSSRAVDGNLNPLFSIGQSCSSTTSQANAWWRLDLEEVVYVAHIFIQFRSRCCDSQATHFLIYAGPHLEDNFPVPGQDFLNYLCSNFTVANIPDHKGWHVHCGRTITARYLYIRLWETNNLTLCEVYVYDDSNDNIALGLPEYTVAVDGDLQTCLDTPFTLDTFLRIDLVFVRPIALVHLVSRLDMTDVAVIVGETLSGDTCNSLDGNVRANVIKEYVCNSPHRISGRYVFITIPSKTASLNLCEVQIYAVYEFDLTKTGSVTQSSTAVINMTADQGVDNDRLTCIATKEQTDPWWKIDLRRYYDVEEVVIYPPSESFIPYSSQLYHVHVDDHLCRSPYLCNSDYRCGVENGYITCECKEEGTFVQMCVTDFDECKTAPCPSDHICNNTVGSYRCECPLGFVEDPSSQNPVNIICNDVDECQFPSTCRSDLVCNNTVGSYRCECSLGYVEDPSSQNPVNVTCVDFDECKTAPCPSDHICNNTVGSYRCECSLGFVEDPSSQNPVNIICNDVDECQFPSTCRSDLVCNNTVGSYRCECSLGYVEDPSSQNPVNVTCVDFDECQSGSACRSDLVCNNTFGSYRCECALGFVEDPSSQNPVNTLCNDVDECVNSVESLGCSSLSNCVNLEGSFFCTCKEGYLGDGHTCQGRREVFEMVCRNRGGLESMCDKSGDYKCKCDNGYVYDSQTQTCRQIV